MEKLGTIWKIRIVCIHFLHVYISKKKPQFFNLTYECQKIYPIPSFNKPFLIHFSMKACKQTIKAEEKKKASNLVTLTRYIYELIVNGTKNNAVRKEAVVNVLNELLVSHFTVFQNKRVKRVSRKIYFLGITSDHTCHYFGCIECS